MKSIIFFLFISVSCFSQSTSFILSKDTVLNSNWDFKGGTLIWNGGTIKGTGSIVNFYIDAPARVQRIFDTGINVKTFSPSISICWFGAGPQVTDNSIPINRAIQIMNANQKYIREVYGPADVYTTYNEIKAEYKRGGAYAAWIGRIRGDGWRDNGTVIKYMKKTGYAINIQLGKNAELEGIAFRGRFKAPDLPEREYFNLTGEQFNDTTCSNDRYRPYAGIAIDYERPIDGKDVDGSTDVRIKNCFSGGFTVSYAFSVNGITKNCDKVYLFEVEAGDCLYAFAGGQDQAKVIVEKFGCWGKTYIISKPEAYGARNSFSIRFINGNIAGKPIILNINRREAWPYGAVFIGTDVESVYSLGVSSGRYGLTWYGNTFKFLSPDKVGHRVLIEVTDYRSLLIRDGPFIQYGSSDPMTVSGFPTFDNITFSGAVITATVDDLKRLPILKNSRTSAGADTDAKFSQSLSAPETNLIVSDSTGTYFRTKNTVYRAGEFLDLKTSNVKLRTALVKVIAVEPGKVWLGDIGIKLETKPYIIRKLTTTETVKKEAKTPLVLTTTGIVSVDAVSDEKNTIIKIPK